MGSDGAIELTRGAGGAYIDFKDSTAEDFDVRLQASGSQLNIAAAGGLTLNGAGVLTGITSGQVTTALGYTPYNATNPAGYITSSALSGYLPLTGGSLNVGGVSNTHQFNYNESGGEFQLIDSTGAGPILLDNVSGLARLYKVGSGAMSIGTTGANYLQFITNGSERLRIDDSGNVLINRSSASGIGKLNVEGGADVTSGNVTVQAGYGIAWRGDQTRIITPDDNVYGALIKWGATGGCRFFESTTERMRIDGTGSVTVNVDIRAPIFYDSPNSAYYLDPAGTSNLNQINLGDSTKFIRGGGSGQTILGVGGVNEAYLQVGGSYYSIWNSGNFNPASYLPLTGGTLTGDLGMTKGAPAIVFTSSTSGRAASFGMTDGYNMYLNAPTNGVLFLSEFRAPLMRDTDNSAYYINAADTSVLNNLSVNGGTVFRSDWTTRYQSPSDFVDGTLVTTDIPATAGAGDSFVIEITGKSYNQDNPPFKVVAQGYLYNDTIINYSGISYAGNFASYIKVFQEGGVLKFWWPRISYWNSFNVNVMSMDGQTNGTITRNRVTAIGNSTEPTGTKKQQIDLIRSLTTSNYNSYALPLSGGTLTGSVTIPELFVSDNTPTFTSSAFQYHLYQSPHVAYVKQTGGYNWYWRRNSTGTLSGANEVEDMSLTEGGNLIVRSDVRAPLFYDSPDTSWFLDPSSTSVLNIVRANAIEHVNGTDAIQLTDGSYLYFRSPDNGIRMYLGGADPANYYDNDTHYFRNRATAIRAELTSNDGFKIGPNTSGQYTRLGGNGGAADMCTVSASNGNFHIDAKTGNNLYLSWYNVATTYVGGEIAATVFRDRDNSAYFIDPTAIQSLRTVGDWRSDSSDWTGEFNGKIQYHANNWYFQSANEWLFRKSDTNSAFRVTQAGLAIAASSFDAPTFRDSSDTSYYLDPFSTGLALRVNGNMECYARSAAWSEGYRVRVPSRATWGGIRFTRDDANSNGNWAIGFTGIDSTDDLTFWGNLNGAEGMRARLTQTGNFSITGASVAYSYQGNGNVGGTGSASWHPSGIYSAGYNWLYGGIAAGGGDITGVNAVYAAAYYDSPNTAFYVDPASTSNISSLTVANRINGSISGDAQRLFNHTGANNDGLQYWNTVGNDTLNPNTGWH
ncbi:hypothetical protein, partial [Flavobacterium sp.]|uniref:hypothetical protein n=1 Tax=Flavobacterium sp. TaxID=239 RepID=UPI0037C16427